MLNQAVNKKIFCLDDDELFQRMLKYKLSLDPEYEVTIFEDAKSMLQCINMEPDVVTLDLNLPDMEGVEVMKIIQDKSPSTQVVVLSTENDIQKVSELFKLGIFDYIAKDQQSMERIWQVVHKATSHAQLDKEVHLLREEMHQQYQLQTEAKGTSEEMQEVFNLVRKTLRSNINVVISGETGTGKELIAKTIHYNSLQKKKPFVAINVAAIPDELIESELFGYEKGAFTGANETRIGQLEYARGGTLFLDEIAEMSLPMQAKLLRVLQEMEIVRLGSNKRIAVDFRLITASHKDLIDAVQKGQFREDLYYRIVGVHINLPPLRNRGKDIIILANYFIEQFAKANKLKTKKLSLSAIKALSDYSFPGNIRELKAIVETALIMSEDQQIVASDLLLTPKKTLHLGYEEGKTLEYYTNLIIQDALKKNEFNVLLTAKKLDISKSKIYKLIQEGKIIK
jgi:two-component system response regulator AtoC